MFGWNIAQQQSSPRTKLIEALNHLLVSCDSASGNLNAKTLADFQSEIEACGKLVSALSPTEQSKISLYWTGGVESFNTALGMYGAMPKLKIMTAKSMLPNVKIHILNTLKELS